MASGYVKSRKRSSRITRTRARHDKAHHQGFSLAIANGVREKNLSGRRNIPSAPGELYSRTPSKPSFLRMQKPSTGVYPGSRYYDLERGQFLMASTIGPAIAEGYLAGIEIWASFLQPNDYSSPDPLVARISYATPSHPLAIVGLHGSIG